MKARMFLVRLALLLLFIATIELERRQRDEEEKKVVIELYPTQHLREAS